MFRRRSYARRAPARRSNYSRPRYAPRMRGRTGRTGQARRGSYRPVGRRYYYGGRFF